MRRIVAVLSLISALPFSAPATSAHAQTYITTNTTYHGTRPDPGVFAHVIDHASNPLLTLSGGVLVDTSTLLVGPSNKGSLLITDGADLNVYGSNAEINIPGYFQMARTGRSTVGHNGTGVATVSGAGSTWFNDDALHVGATSGHGTLNVENGGYVFGRNSILGAAQQSVGIAKVSGLNSQWLYNRLTVGATGQLTIENGGSVSGSTSGYLQGDATVTGRNAGVSSKWSNASDFFVGSSSGASLSILDGGEVTNPGGYIGDSSNDTGTVTVSGKNAGVSSKWTNTGNLWVGRAGEGTLRIENGGEVSNQTGLIALNANSQGEVFVSGAGSKWTNSNLRIGGSSSAAGGTGSLTIGDGGLVVVTNSTKIWNNGTLTLNGGTLDTYSLDASLGTFNFISGTLRVAGGTTFAANTTLNISGANSTFVNSQHISVPVVVTSGAKVTGSGSFANLTVHAGGVVSPGNSPGTMTDAVTGWNGGGKYLWEINSLGENGGAAGSVVGWDNWNTGVLTVGATHANPFIIAIASLNSLDAEGSLASWTPTMEQSWRIATATNSGGIFDDILGSLVIDATGFTQWNNINGGSFVLSAQDGGKELWLTFTPVPEPSMFALAMLATGGLVGAVARRARILNKSLPAS